MAIHKYYGQYYQPYSARDANEKCFSHSLGHTACHGYRRQPRRDVLRRIEPLSYVL